MRRVLICLIIFYWVFLVIPTCSQAREDWIPLQKFEPFVYFDKESIQFPHKKVYSLGLFTIEKTDKNIARVWTKFDFKQAEVPHTLYEIKFSQRLYRALYSVDRYGNRIHAYDTAFRPIVPDSIEECLFESLQPIVKLEENNYPLADIDLDE
ncbi:MAG: hypothetical protein ACE14T_05610 [Syntrophales bacterium]